MLRMAESLPRVTEAVPTEDSLLLLHEDSAVLIRACLVCSM